LLHQKPNEHVGQVQLHLIESFFDFLNFFKHLDKLKNLGLPTISTTSALISSKELSTSSTNDQRVPSRLVQFPSQPQHFIDAYMSPPPPPPLPTSFLIEGDDPLNSRIFFNEFYESRHISTLRTNQPTTSLDDYSLFYAANHGATKL